MEKNDETLPLPGDEVYLGTAQPDQGFLQLFFPSLEAGCVVVHQRNEQLLVMRGYDEVIESRIPVRIDGVDEVNIEEV
jgi:hypothetical protein